jgi:hypothetical protein
MNAEDQKLKNYMQDNFDFSGLNELGFYKGINKADYKAQAERVTKFFSLKSVYEYKNIGKGVGFHLSTVAVSFNCPICTCENEVDSDKAINHKMICIGCKRQLIVTGVNLSGYNICASDDFKDNVDSFDNTPFVISI